MPSASVPCLIAPQSIHGTATNASAAEGEKRTMVNIPIQTAIEWRKVVIGPQTHPQLQAIDPRRICIFGSGGFAQDEAANAI